MRRFINIAGISSTPKFLTYMNYQKNLIPLKLFDFALNDAFEILSDTFFQKFLKPTTPDCIPICPLLLYLNISSQIVEIPQQGKQDTWLPFSRI